MAVYTLWMVVTYMRPGEPLTIRRRDLRRPLPGINRHWHVILFQKRSARSKVLAANDSVEVWAPWADWITKACESLADGPQEGRIFPFSYPQYTVPLQRVSERLGVTVVPYQARHSGPSIASALHLRTRPEMRARGRWASEKSVMRYERPARLTESYLEMSEARRAHCARAKELFGQLIAGQIFPDALPLPPP